MNSKSVKAEHRTVIGCATSTISAVVLSIFLVAPAWSQTAVSEAEWLAWPHSCKAGYLLSDWSLGSPYTGRLSGAEVARYREAHGSVSGISGIHHFCVGMLYVNRARAMSDKARRKGELERAVNELEYWYSRTQSNAAQYSLLTAYYGTALHGLGKQEEARRMWNRGIEAHPTHRESYLAMAQALLNEKRYKEALDILLTYDSKKQHPTPDGEYFLAFTYYELKNFAKAREHAENAQRLGYPFPGLLKKLQKLQ